MKFSEFIITFGKKCCGSKGCSNIWERLYKLVETRIKIRETFRNMNIVYVQDLHKPIVLNLWCQINCFLYFFCFHPFLCCCGAQPGVFSVSAWSPAEYNRNIPHGSGFSNLPEPEYLIGAISNFTKIRGDITGVYCSLVSTTPPITSVVCYQWSIIAGINCWHRD